MNFILMKNLPHSLIFGDDLKEDYEKCGLCIKTMSMGAMQYTDDNGDNIQIIKIKSLGKFNANLAAMEGRVADANDANPDNVVSFEVIDDVSRADHKSKAAASRTKERADKETSDRAPMKQATEEGTAPLLAVMQELLVVMQEMLVEQKKP